eukprot:223684_1
MSEYVQQLLLVERYQRNELDTMHINMCHTNVHKNKSETQSTQMTVHNIDMDGEQSKKTEMTPLEHGETSMIELDEIEDIKSRYMTDIGLYGFGVDHQHHELGPLHDTMC